MSEKKRFLVLPSEVFTVPNPAQKLFAAHCEPAGFLYPKRVIATTDVFKALDKYPPLQLPSWWRTADKPPRFGTRAAYFERINTFFEDRFDIDAFSPLHRPVHETTHALIKHIDPKLRRFSSYFIEGTSEWLACELLNRAANGKDNVHEETLKTKYRKIELAEKNGYYPDAIREEHQRYVHGHQAVYDVMIGLFTPETPLLRQLEFVIDNYDPMIVGNKAERDTYIDYYRMILKIKNEEQAQVAD